MANIRTWFNELTINTQLMILLTLLNVVDFQTTAFLVHLYGFGVEANPLMYNAMVLVDSVCGLLIVKGIVLGSLWWLYDRVDHETHKLINPERMTYLLAGLVAAFVALCVWNYSLIAMVLLP